jgi:stage IV sporulation protein FB
MTTDIKLFTFRGVPVTLSLWFFLLLPLVGFNFNVFISAFIAILIHEMAHTFMAQHLGYGAYGISIGLFAGQAQVDSNMHTRDNIKVVAAGPLSNLILALIGVFLGFETFFAVNFFLFIFNILPIYPMDGGHICKDLLMLNMRNRRKAFELAMNISLVTSVFLLIFGMLSGGIMISIFACIFGYYALKELGYIK